MRAICPNAIPSCTVASVCPGGFANGKQRYRWPRLKRSNGPKPHATKHDKLHAALRGGFFVVYVTDPLTAMRPGGKCATPRRPANVVHVAPPPHVRNFLHLRIHTFLTDSLTARRFAGVRCVSLQLPASAPPSCAFALWNIRTRSDAKGVSERVQNSFKISPKLGQN